MTTGRACVWGRKVYGVGVPKFSERLRRRWNADGARGDNPAGAAALRAIWREHARAHARTIAPVPPGMRFGGGARRSVTVAATAVNRACRDRARSVPCRPLAAARAFGGSPPARHEETLQAAGEAR